MDQVKVGLILPHEIFATFYEFQDGVLFYNIMTGKPEENWSWTHYINIRKIEHPSAVQDLERYWNHNMDLAEDLELEANEKSPQVRFKKHDPSDLDRPLSKLCHTGCMEMVLMFTASS